jgi:hypothetical protein
MARHAGTSTRLKYLGTAIAACAAGAVALLALPWATGIAAAQTSTAALTMTGAHTATAPGGTGTISLQQGDSLVFSAGPGPQRALLGFYVILDAAPFGGSSAVKLSGGKTYTVQFPSAGSYSFSWSGYSTLGKISPRSGEYTSATVDVAATPSDPPPDTGGGGGGSTPPDTGGAPPPSSTSTVVAPPGSSLPAPGLPGVPGQTGTNSAPIIVFTTNAQGHLVPISIPTFGAPRDGGLLGSSTLGVVGLQGTPGAGVPGGGGNGGALAGNGNADQQFVADAHAATPPRALAVLSITSLAGVAGSYAWLYLGRRAARAVGKG